MQWKNLSTMESADTESRYGATWRITPDLLGILDSSGYFGDTNPAWFNTLGWSPEEIESRLFFDFIHSEDMPRTRRAFEEVQQGKPVLAFKNRYRHKDGSYRWLSWNVIPEGRKFFCNARDITREMENAAALHATEEEARLREQFIAVLGHDLRNPLAALSSAKRLLEGEPQTDKSLNVLKMMDQSVSRMSVLLDDLMDFARSRLGSGISLNRTSDKLLKPALEHTISEIQAVYPKAQIISVLDFNDPLRCDIGRVSQLLSNLLANAVTHGNAHYPVKVCAKDERDKFILSVTNAGTPLHPEVQEQLFQPFVRREVHKSQQGLGLGLFISSEIAKAHDGEVTVFSDEIETRFTFRMKRG